MKYFREFSLQDKLDFIKETYLADERPWLILWSSGKDSSTTLQLCFQALIQLKEEGQKLHKKVYVVTADTGVENPLIINRANNILKRIDNKAKDLNLPIVTKTVKRKLEDSFWVKLIGKGYAPPKQKLRWCTDRLKIKPSNEFVRNKVSEKGEVVIILGVRKGESNSRDRVLEKNNVERKGFKKHNTLKNAYVFTPIEDFSLKDVWYYLISLTGTSPYDTNNHKLYKLYKDSSSECPMTMNNDQASCGNSRWGCWVCTLIKEDKSLTGFLKTGHKWLKPLLKFRNYLYEIRDNHSYRDPYRRTINKEIVYKLNKNGKDKLGPGGLNLETRKNILKKLLKTEKKVKDNLDYPLITKEELELIRSHWIRKGDITDSVPKIYKNIYNKPLHSRVDENYLFDSEEEKNLKKECWNNEVNPELIKRMITIVSENIFNDDNQLVKEELKNILNFDWPYIESIEKLKEIQGVEINENV